MAFYDLDKPVAPRDAVAFYRRRAAQAIGPVLEPMLPRRYGLAFIPSGSLGLIHRTAGLRASLSRLRRHLCPSATLFLEMMVAESFELGSAGAGARSVDTGDGRSIRYAWRSTSDPGRRTVHYDSRYQLREADRVLVEESERLC